MSYNTRAMKKSNLWGYPITTVLGAVAAVGIYLASPSLGLPDYVTIPAMAVAVFVGALSPDPKKPNQ